MSETISCSTKTIDQLVSEGVPPPQLLKVDVEGAERLVIAGASEYLASHRPTMIIETSNIELVQLILAFGYVAFQVDSENLLFIAATKDCDLGPFVSVFPRCGQVS